MHVISSNHYTRYNWIISLSLFLIWRIQLIVVFLFSINLTAIGTDVSNANEKWIICFQPKATINLRIIFWHKQFNIEIKSISVTRVIREEVGGSICSRWYSKQRQPKSVFLTLSCENEKQMKKKIMYSYKRKSLQRQHKQLGKIYEWKNSCYSIFPHFTRLRSICIHSVDIALIFCYLLLCVHSTWLRISFASLRTNNMISVVFLVVLMWIWNKNLI